jgi:hypothetical protein
VKKCLLFISLLVYFLPAVSGNENASFHKSFSLSVEANGYTLLYSEYPHSELVFNTHTVLISSGNRHQILPGFITAAASSERPFQNKEMPSAYSKSHISSKQYLFHIYPSHNFW